MSAEKYYVELTCCRTSSFKYISAVYHNHEASSCGIGMNVK